MPSYFEENIMILIVDSEKIPDAQKKQYFIESGLESVVVAKSAQAARDIITGDNKNKLSLIVIDSELDDESGFDFCREIKKMELLKNTYIILLVSSIKNKTAIEKAKRSGASMFAVKPYYSAEFQNNFMHFMATKVILLVEDDPIVQQMVKKLLSHVNIELISIDDGIKANNILNKLLPTRLVLMDIGLPNINGIQLVEKIRSNSKWRKTPIVMLTGSSETVDVKKCLAVGANDYLTKPIDIDGFRKRLQRFLPDEE